MKNSVQLLPRLILLVSFSIGCSLEVPEGRFVCETELQCPSGWVCRNHLCYRPGLGYAREDAGIGQADAGSTYATDADTYTDADTDADTEPNFGDCRVGEQRSCADGGYRGACARGIQVCLDTLTWSACSVQKKETDTCDPGNDDNCNGIVNEGCPCEEDQTRPCSQGGLFGECADGEQVCDAAGEWGACSISPSSAETCDNRDEDCDGETDEDYDSLPTICGIGACLATGNWICVQGEEINTCTAGNPAPDDSLCNNIDDDCDGSTDEDFVEESTSCGTGPCAAVGRLTCIDGIPTDSCVEGTGAPNDDDCDDVDNNCDGRTDEGYTPSQTSCGVGACKGNTGFLICNNGTETDTCDPYQGAATDDANCNGVDDDCDGETDEEGRFVGVTDITWNIENSEPLTNDNENDDDDFHPSCDEGGYKYPGERLFSFQPTLDFDYEVWIDTDHAATEFDTVISVYLVDDFCNPEEIGCNDDFGFSRILNGASGLSFNAIRGRRYLIVVHGYSNADNRGTFGMNCDYP